MIKQIKAGKFGCHHGFGNAVQALIDLMVQELFGGVKTVQFRYLDGNQTWQTQWPPPGLPQNEGLWVRPVAVEITIEFKDWGRVQRVVEVAG